MKINIYIIIIWLLIIPLSSLTAQITPDSSVVKQDTVALPVADSISLGTAPTTFQDSLINPLDSNFTPPTFPDGFAPSAPRTDLSQVTLSKDSLDAPLDYNAKDSIIYDLQNEQIILFGTATVTYETTTMTAGYIVVDKKNNIVTATGREEGSYAPFERPTFTDGTQNFTATKLRFNYETKKGVVTDAQTEQDLMGNNMYVQSKRTKFVSQGDTTQQKIVEGEEDSHEGHNHGDKQVIYSANSTFTTCNHPNPHFGLRSRKQKIIPDKLIVVGPSNLEIAGIPTPVWIPFGAFPLGQNKKTGLIFSNNWEFSEVRGVGIQNIGWYFPINDYINMQVLGDIYSRGSFALRTKLDYKRKYRYTGNADVVFNNVRTEDNQGMPINTQSMRIVWSHNQDRAAHPTRTLRGSVNFTTNNDQKRNLNDAGSVLNNTLSSNVYLSNSIPGTPFTYNISAQHSQNTRTRSVSVTLPSLDFRMRQINPFKAKKPENRGKWYEDITLQYQMNAQNQLRGTDTTFFDAQTWEEARMGVKHTASTSTNFKLFEFFNVSPNASYEEVWNFRTLSREFDEMLEIDTTFQVNSEGTDSIPIYDTLSYGSIQDMIVKGFEPWRNVRTGVSINTSVFSTAQFGKGYLRGIRHTMRPTVSMNYSPNYEFERFNPELEIIDSNGEPRTQTYNVFNNSPYGRPPSGGPNLGITYGINNDFEAKVYSKKDSTEKKVKLFNNIGINGNYNFIADSLNWSFVSMRGNTRFFQGLTVLNVSLQFDPYAARYDKDGRKFRNADRFHFSETGKFLRFDQATFSLTNRITVKQLRNLFEGKGLKGNKKTRTSNSAARNLTQRENPVRASDKTDKPQSIMDLLDNFSFNHVYRFTLESMQNGDTLRVDGHNITMRGSIQLTDKWRIGLTQISYNLQTKRLVYPDFTFSRDLHCWQMSMNWQPSRNTYFFTIQVKPGSFFDKISIPYQKNIFDAGGF